MSNTLLSRMTKFIKVINDQPDQAEIERMIVSKKMFDRLSFEIMSNDRQVSNPKEATKWFAGYINIMGVLIDYDRQAET